MEALESASYVLLTTFRRDGTAVPTPVGPIARDGKLYVYTPAASGKAKRVRRTARVELAPCTRRGDPTGSTVRANARILLGAEAESLQVQFRREWRRRYGPAYFLMALVERIRGVERCVIEVSPSL